MEKSLYSPDQKKMQTLLRQIRVDANLTQADLAQILSRPQSFISKYESGERLLDIIELRELCSAVGVSLVDFVKRLEVLLNET
jgi:transcriptional regulator with XRE-family HTH domain